LKVLHSGQTRDCSNSYSSEKCTVLFQNMFLFKHIKSDVWIRLWIGSHVLLPIGNSFNQAYIYSLLSKGYLILSDPAGKSGRELATVSWNPCAVLESQWWLGSPRFSVPYTNTVQCFTAVVGDDISAN
jgi:hypothetical protein